MELHELAAAVHARPDERIHLDWYDGIVQAVLVHDTHGAWFAFATGSPAPGERLLCLRALADTSLIPELEDLETMDDAGWLARFAVERMLPACAPGGAELHLAGDRLIGARTLSVDEAAAARPAPLQSLVR